MLVSLLVAGFWYPYWRIADMDFWIVYNAFLLNSHLPQEYFDHPGYLSILLLSEWLRLLHGAGIIAVASLKALPPVSDAAAFTRAWTEATQAARVLSLVYAIGFVLAFAYLLRALVRDWRAAAFGAFLLAFSGGMAMQMRVLRTELLAAGFFYCALLMLVIAAMRGTRWWRPAVVGLASLLCMLALQNKIQIIFLICALPFLLLPFGADNTRARGFWSAPHRAWPALAVAAVIAAVAAYLASGLVCYGLATGSTSTLSLPTLPISARAYWTAIVVWLTLGFAVYCAWWKVPALEALTAALAAIAGCAIGLLALYLRYHPNDVVVVFHPLEQMFRFGTRSEPKLAVGGAHMTAARLHFLVEAVGGVIARRTFVLATSPRPTIFLEWFVIAATVVAIRRREWGLVAKVAVLMLTVWGVDTLGMIRGLKQEYFLITDPLTIIAAALLIVGLVELQHHRWTYAVGATLVAVTIAFSQAEPVKHAFKTEGPEVLCGLYHNANRVEHLPVCKTLAPH